MGRYSPRTDQEIQDHWDLHWKQILQNPDGSINVEQLKKELIDYSDLANRMRTLTCEITNSRMSYHDYAVEDILGVAAECQQEEIAFQIEDDLEDGCCSFCNREF